MKGKHLILETPPKASRPRKENEERKLRRAKERERKKLGGMGRKEAAFTGLWKLEKEQTKYADEPCGFLAVQLKWNIRYRLFVPLHHLWLGYMSELLGLRKASEQQSTSTPTMPTSAGMHAKLVKADFHGSIISGLRTFRCPNATRSTHFHTLIVKQSKNPCLVGLKGIVILETENAFRIITKKDQIKCNWTTVTTARATKQLLAVIPKRNAIFTFCVPLYDVRSSLPSTEEYPEVDPLDAVPKMEFELYGNQFCFRSADRASKKFKAKETIEL